jgi:hypothetical protein
MDSFLPVFQNACLRVIVENRMVAKKMMPTNLHTVWQETSEDSQLRKCLVDQYLFSFGSLQGILTMDHAKGMPKDLLVEIFARISEFVLCYCWNLVAHSRDYDVLEKR